MNDAERLDQIQRLYHDLADARICNDDRWAKRIVAEMRDLGHEMVVGRVDDVIRSRMPSDAPKTWGDPLPGRSQ